VLIDPPFLISDANFVNNFIKTHGKEKPVAAVFVTHHHPDHYFAANPILDAHQSAQFYAAQYVLDGINREYDEKMKFWPTVLGRENVSVTPQKPMAYPYSFFILEGKESSPVCLFEPVQGSSIDHTLFWMPIGRTIVTGDAV
jgi:glyoxylase-like metal-dependent hydrolase (beta-lactamase superfamily II)